MPFSNQDALLTRRIGLIDSHNDFATAIAARRASGVYDSLATYWLPRFRDGGVSLVVTPIWISSLFVQEGALRRAVQVVDGLLSEIEQCRDEIALVTSFAEIEQARASSKVAILLAFEGAEPLGHDLAALRLFYAVGLRVMSLTWSRRNAFGDGAWENESRGGLTRLGRGGRGRDGPTGHRGRRLARLGRHRARCVVARPRPGDRHPLQRARLT